MNRRTFIESSSALACGIAVGAGLPSNIKSSELIIPNIAAALPWLKKIALVVGEKLLEGVIAVLLEKTLFSSKDEVDLSEIEETTGVPSEQCLSQESYVLPYAPNQKDFMYLLAPLPGKEIYQNQVFIPCFNSLASFHGHAKILSLPATAALATACDEIVQKDLVKKSKLSQMLFPFNLQKNLLDRETVGLNIIRFQSRAGMIGITYEVNDAGEFSGKIEFSGLTGRGVPKNFRTDFSNV